ncbi:MAG: TauD/TfdA dioxygenase family protein [Microthrixaceae bacterium]
MLKILPLDSSFGAEVIGVADAVRSLRTESPDPSLGRALDTALVDHKVLVARGAHLGPEELLFVARAVGEPTVHPLFPHLEGYPPIVEVINLGPEIKATSVWHSDVTFEQEPPSVTMLSAQTLPDRGGDTLFADTEAALDSLPISEVVDLQASTARHEGLGVALLTGSDEAPASTHPVVRTHPVSGRRSLFVNDAFTTAIIAGPATCDRSGIHELVVRATQDRFLLRHRWSAGDLVMWDNRSTLHFHEHDYGWAERRLIRVTLAGDRPT